MDNSIYKSLYCFTWELNFSDLQGPCLDLEKIDLAKEYKGKITINLSQSKLMLLFS